MIEIIGHGGMGAVYKVRQPKLDRFAALKLLPQSLAGDPAFASRFEREARLLARLNHANIVAVYDHGQAGEFFYVLMEFVDGVNLRQAMRASRFTPAQALGVVPKICEALQFAHDEGVLHRDIKPENILLDAKGRVKLVDFGIAKLIGDGTHESNESHAAHDSHLTQTGATLGTPQYMAPEQRDRPESVDHRADIYSLGVVFYELLTGELPVGKFALPSEISASDPRVDAIVRQALEKERDRRQQSAGEVRTQVEAVTGSSERTSPMESQRPDAAVPPPVEPRKSSAGKWIVGGCAVLAVIGVVLLLLIAGVFYLRMNNVTQARTVRGNEMARQQAKTDGIPQVRFKFSHPDQLTGSHTITMRAKAGTDARWFPSTGQSFSLKGGKDLEFKVRIAASTAGSTVAWVSTKLNGKWEDSRADLGAGNTSASLDFANGLHVSVRLLEDESYNPDISPLPAR